MRKLQRVFRNVSLFVVLLVTFHRKEGHAQGVSVNCSSGGTIKAALAGLKPGDTLTVNGTCNESVTIDAEVSRITLDGHGSATIHSPNPTFNTLTIRGKEITIRGFLINGGNNGVLVQRGATAVVDGNTIRDNGITGASSCRCVSGILVGPLSAAVIVNNVIENNGFGISAEENSNVRIGFQAPTTLGLPNVIQNNLYSGISVSQNSNVRVIGATIRNNGDDGIRVDRASHADISDNNISNNKGNGITIGENSGVNLNLGRIQPVALPNRTEESNGGFGLVCALGSYVSGDIGTLTGLKGVFDADKTCVHGLDPIVTGLALHPATVKAGGVFTAVFSGESLSPETYFDIRFCAPECSIEEEMLNWQLGIAGTHTVASSTSAGTYAVISVRPHTESPDHSGPYTPVSTNLTIRP